jgi:hypothetical protein
LTLTTRYYNYILVHEPLIIRFVTKVNYLLILFLTKRSLFLNFSVFAVTN